jgi:anti-anti-sigma regulatory factor
MRETNYVSSGGWGAFLSAAKSAREAGGDLLLAGMRAEVFDAFELLEYDKVLRTFTTPEKALDEGLKQARPA